MKAVIFKGKEYESLQEFANEHGISRQHAGWLVRNDNRFRGAYLDYKIDLHDKIQDKTR